MFKKIKQRSAKTAGECIKIQSKITNDKYIKKTEPVGRNAFTY